MSFSCFAAMQWFISLNRMCICLFNDIKLKYICYQYHYYNYCLKTLVVQNRP